MTPTILDVMEVPQTPEPQGTSLLRIAREDGRPPVDDDPATAPAVFGLSAFVGNLTGGYVTDNFLSVGGGFQGIQTGLLISAAFRFLTGLLYVMIYETYKPEE